jgi:hypothetical protein
MVPLCTLLAISACSSSKPAATEHWALVVGMGGGFSGFTQGFKMTEDGDIYRWRAEIVDRQGTTIGKIPAAAAAKWREELMALDFMKFVLYAPGNVTTFVEYETDASRHAVTWGDPKQKTPEQIADWMNKFSAFCSELDKK